jgi:hypothetical protein
LQISGDSRYDAVIVSIFRPSALVWLGLLALASLSLYFFPNPWAGWVPDPCRTRDCFCETFQDRLVLQPLVAYSNLAYVLVGGLVLASRPSVSGAGNRLRAQPAYASLYGLMTLGIGVGSFFYHASLTRVGEWFDLMGMYALTGFLVLYNLTRLRALTGKAFGALYLTLLTVLGLGLVLANAWQQVYMAALVLAALVLEGLVLAQRRPHVRWPYLLGGVACFGLGALFWVNSAPGGWCGRLGPIPPHTVWHLLSAVAAGSLFLYYRSEVQ